MLSKTLRASAKKIKSAPKAVLGAAALGCLAIIILISVLAPGVVREFSCSGLSVNGQCIALERATTDQARMQGLSDRDSLAVNTGMLFVFGQPAQQCFWMKDMRFNIDMIWLDGNKRVVKIMENVEPSTYPNSYCADNTRYVIELNSNTATKLGITPGQRLQF